MADEMDDTGETGTLRNTPDFSEMGVTGLTRWGNYVYEEFLPQLLYPQAAKVYKEMSDNDPTIGAVIYMVKQLIKKAGWSVTPASESATDVAAAQFLQECMDDMSTTWDDFISETLSKFVYGFSFHEIVYKTRGGPNAPTSASRSKYSDGRVGWAKMPGRSQHTLYAWNFEDNGDVKAFIQQSPPLFAQTTIPLCKGLLFRTEVARDNPEGRSLLRNAYRSWYFKKRIEEIEGIGIERDLAGLPMIQPPENVDIWDPTNQDAARIKAIAENMVRNVRRDRSEGVVIPFGWAFTLMSTGGTRQFDTNAIINRWDNRIAITLLADIVMMGGDKVGSFALGEVKKSLLAASLESQNSSIADVLNKFAVPYLFKYNYFPGITNLPKITPGQVETPDIKELAFLIRSAGLRVSGDLPLMNMLRQLISLDAITQEQLDTWYAAPEVPDPGADKAAANMNSKTKNPLDHAMDDSTQNK